MVLKSYWLKSKANNLRNDFFCFNDKVITDLYFY